MIGKLQKKLIFLSMSAFFVVCAIIITVINCFNYHSIVVEADESIEKFADNKNDSHRGPELNDVESPHNIHPVRADARYFAVNIDVETGKISFDETDKLLSFDITKAQEYAYEVYSRGSASGFIDGYRYNVISEESFERILFLDCGRELKSFNRFMLISITITLVGFLIVFVLISFFSSRIIRPIAESYSKQRTFITNASHELKTPLAVISADVDVLEIDAPNNEWLTDIKKQITRLTKLTNDLLILTRMEENKSELNYFDFPISDVFAEAAASYQTVAKCKNIEYNFNIEEMITFKGDEASIYQLINILLDNAFKYCPEKGNVQLFLKKQSKYLSLSVKNNTESKIDIDALEKLFDRFYRPDSARNSEKGGAGVGLSIAKAIVETHGGKIYAILCDNNIIEFKVQLPI